MFENKNLTKLRHQQPNELKTFTAMNPGLYIIKRWNQEEQVEQIVNLHGSDFKYHLAHCSVWMSLSMSSQVLMFLVFTCRVQTSLSLYAATSCLHVPISWTKLVLGHSLTQVCGVGQPLSGTRGSAHLAKLKNTRYFLSMTSLS